MSPVSTGISRAYIMEKTWLKCGIYYAKITIDIFIINVRSQSSMYKVVTLSINMIL